MRGKRKNVTVPSVPHGMLGELWTNELFDRSSHRIQQLTDVFVYMCASAQAVEELLESLDLEKSSYHMGLSRVSITTAPQTNKQL